MSFSRSIGMPFVWLILLVWPCFISSGPPVFEAEGVTLIPSKVVGKRFKPIPPTGLRGHLVDITDPDVEFVFPASESYFPPAGIYRAWASGEWQISPFSMVLSYGARPGSRLQVAVPMGPAGRVILPAKAPSSEHLVLRLLHAGEYRAADVPTAELTRRVPSLAIGEGVLMPVGTTMAVLWNERTSGYVALTRPFEVLPRQRVVAPLEEPTDKAFLVVQLLRQKVVASAHNYDSDVVLRIGESEVSPTLVVATNSRIYAFWFDLPPGEATLEAGSESSSLEPESIHLQAGEISRVLSRLQPALDLDAKFPSP